MIAAIPVVYISYELIYILILGVMVQLASLKDPNKIAHLMKPEHHFNEICFLECIQESLVDGVEGKEGQVVYHREYCKHGCEIETRGKIVNNQFQIGTSFHISICKVDQSYNRFRC